MIPKGKKENGDILIIFKTHVKKQCLFQEKQPGYASAIIDDEYVSFCIQAIMLSEPKNVMNKT